MEKQQPEFATRAQEELHYAGKQGLKAITIVVVLAILLYITHFLSTGFTLLFAAIGFILFLATATYSVGHFVRFLYFKAKGV
jgi:hypothetical protein